jgi:hypothetical protein
LGNIVALFREWGLKTVYFSLILFVKLQKKGEIAWEIRGNNRCGSFLKNIVVNNRIYMLKKGEHSYVTII